MWTLGRKRNRHTFENEDTPWDELDTIFSTLSSIGLECGVLLIAFPFWILFTLLMLVYNPIVILLGYVVFTIVNTI